MVFLSFDFLASFSVFLCVYWIFQHRTLIQNILLLIASYCFIGMFSIGSASVLFGYSTVIYFIALISSKYGWRKVSYAALLFSVFAFFFIFKYYVWGRELIMGLLQFIGIQKDLPVLDIIVPVGISFYIFHSVSYIVSVVKREIKPVSFFTLLLYLGFFPSVVSGPINRAKTFIPQLTVSRPRQLDEWQRGIFEIALSMLKLFCLSSLAQQYLVDDIFSSPESYSGIKIISAAYGYAWQIYFNFSGYTNLVTGIALLLGFHLPENFNSPYLAHSLKEFWSRWHISLSSFIRDYIYIPLGGSQHGLLRANLNVIIAMMLSGLWHGAGLTFIVWGGIHGVGLALLNIKNKLLPSCTIATRTPLFARFLTFNFVSFCWIFFRSLDIDSALTMVTRIPEIKTASSTDVVTLIVVLFAYLIYPQLTRYRKHCCEWFIRQPWWFLPIPLASFVSILFILSPDGVPGFIYANF